MCGICGIVDIQSNRQIDQNLLVKIRDTMVHRGPDESGVYVDNGLGFGHRRLSIIDVASGQQPFSNPSGSITVTYNGEIYNFRDLSSELKSLGYQFQTDSDTEVIVHAWDAWGEACVERFRGMFAFAIWDREKDTVFLARDRLGIKPVYYGVTDDGYFVFASELKALRAHPGFTFTINGDSVVNYFTFGYVPQPDSIYNGIHKLASGHTISIRNKKLQAPVEYWDVPLNANKTGGDYQEDQEELVKRLQEAIDIRMVAEVPLGAFLSGGVDSSTVVALMSELQEQALNTCSIGFEQNEFDETKYAKSVASQFGTNHNELIVDGENTNLVSQLAGIYDEPYSDSSAIPTVMLCELARKDVTVALSGDGADELLAGYRRHRLHMVEERFRSAIPDIIKRKIIAPLGELYPKADWAPRIFRAKTTLQALGQSSSMAYLNSVSMIAPEQRDLIFSDSFKQKNNLNSAQDVFAKHAEKANTDDPLLLMQYLDIKTYLEGDILTKVDRASMAHSLEVRVPFLDHVLLEWLMRLPNNYKLQKGQGKRVLKDAMRSRLDSKLLDRNKMGFSVPLGAWTRGPLNAAVRQALDNEKFQESGIFNTVQLKKMLTAHERGHSDFSTLFWSVLMFNNFLELN